MTADFYELVSFQMFADERWIVEVVGFKQLRGKALEQGDVDYLDTWMLAHPNIVKVVR